MGLTIISSGYKVMLTLKIFQTKFSSLFIRCIMTIDGKYTKLRGDFSRCLFKTIVDLELLGISSTQPPIPPVCDEIDRHTDT